MIAKQLRSCCQDSWRRGGKGWTVSKPLVALKYRVSLLIYVLKKKNGVEMGFKYLLTVWLLRILLIRAYKLMAQVLSHCKHFHSFPLFAFSVLEVILGVWEINSPVGHYEKNHSIRAVAWFLGLNPAVDMNLLLSCRALWPPRWVARVTISALLVTTLPLHEVLISKY